MIAAQSGLAIVPVGIGFVRAWRVGSWDRFALPLPGSTLVGVIGEPMFVPRDIDRGAMKQWGELVEKRLLELTHLAEDWARQLRGNGLAPPPTVFRTASLRQSA